MIFKLKFCRLELGNYFRRLSDERMYYSGGEIISDAVDVVEDRHGEVVGIGVKDIGGCREGVEDIPGEEDYVMCI